MKKIIIALCALFVAVALFLSVEPAEATYYTMQDALNVIAEYSEALDSIAGISINVDSIMALALAGNVDLDSLITLLIALAVAQGISLDSLNFWADSLDIRQQKLANYLYVIEDSVKIIPAGLRDIKDYSATMTASLGAIETDADALNGIKTLMDSIAFWADSTDVRHGAFITWYDSIGTLALERNALLTTANTWCDSTAYSQDAIATSAATVATAQDTLIKTQTSIMGNAATTATAADSIVKTTTTIRDTLSLAVAVDLTDIKTEVAATAISSGTVAAGVDTTIEMLTAIEDTLGIAIAPDITLGTASLAAIETDAAAIEVLNAAIRDSIGAGNADLTSVTPDIEEIRVDAEAIKTAVENIEDTLGTAIAPDITLMTADLDAIATLQNSIYSRLDSITQNSWRREVVYAAHDATVADTTFFTTGWGVADGGRICLQVYAGGIVDAAGEPLIIAETIEEGRRFPLYTATGNTDPTDTLVIADGTHLYTTWLVSGYNASIKIAIDRYPVFGDSICIIYIPDDASAGTIDITGRYKEE